MHVAADDRRRPRIDQHEIINDHVVAQRDEFCADDLGARINTHVAAELAKAERGWIDQAHACTSCLNSARIGTEAVISEGTNSAMAVPTRCICVSSISMKNGSPKRRSARSCATGSGPAANAANAG